MTSSLWLNLGQGMHLAVSDQQASKKKEKGTKRKQKTQKNKQMPNLWVFRRLIIEQGNEMPRQLPVCGVIDLVQHQVNEIKSRHQAGRQLDVVHNADAGVVATAHWVGNYAGLCH